MYASVQQLTLDPPSLPQAVMLLFYLNWKIFRRLFISIEWLFMEASPAENVLSSSSFYLVPFQPYMKAWENDT